MIVSRILEEYAANDLGRVQGALRDPAEAMGTVRGVGPVHVLDKPGAAHNGHARHGPSGHSQGSSPPSQANAAPQTHRAPGDQNARDAIDRGAADVRKDDAAAKAGFNGKATSTKVSYAKVKKDVE